jgi:DNA modification methylase
MSEPYYSDSSATLWHGDSLTMLRQLDAGSVDCCVTSPPYYGLRDYGVEGQYGLESSPAEYVETMRQVFSEVRRVLADDGTLWLNIGDSYASDSKWGGSTGGKHVAALHGDTGVGRGRRSTGLPDKNLIGIPWRTAFALQDDGWILRNAIVWHKPNAMPESVTDRLAGRYETVFLFSKSRRYWFDLDSIREAHAESTIAAAARARVPYVAPGQKPNAKTRAMAEAGANPGDVWAVNTQPFSAAHFAVMPVSLAQRCISAGCKPGGTVLDPFSGSGTTGLAAAKLGRKYVGIDLSSEYLDLSLRTRLQQAGLEFGESA